MKIPLNILRQLPLKERRHGYLFVKSENPTQKEYYGQIEMRNSDDFCTFGYKYMLLEDSGKRHEYSAKIYMDLGLQNLLVCAIVSSPPGPKRDIVLAISEQHRSASEMFVQLLDLFDLMTYRNFASFNTNEDGCADKTRGGVIMVFPDNSLKKKCLKHFDIDLGRFIFNFNHLFG